MRWYKIFAILLLGWILAFTFFARGPKPFTVSAELQEQVLDKPLTIEGEVPSWLSGTLIRNGPIQVTIGEKSSDHLFDGLAMLHAFSFHDSEVHYTNKFLASDAYHLVFEKGSLNYSGFASDPCRSLFKKFLTFFLPNQGPSIQNANVNVAKLADTYVALTEVPLPVKFDPKTLETIGVLDYQDELPKDKCWESAHPYYDIDQKTTTNYLIEFGRKSYYTIYTVQDQSPERKILTRVPVSEPSYMHSFATTQNYVILTEFPLVVKPLDLILSGKAFIKNFVYEPERGTQFTVIDRKNGNVIGKYKTKPFFAFHHVNAFEDGDTIHIDIATYEDAKIITEENLHANDDSNNHCPSQVERFSLSLKTGAITSDVLLYESAEFPRIHDAFSGKPYTYAYLAAFNNDQASEGEGLYKLNTTTKDVLEWSEMGCSSGEPVFVPAPDAVDEDDGVVLAVIIDYIHNNSFLLILDAKTFTEIARANAPHLIPFGFHGQYFT